MYYFDGKYNDDEQVLSIMLFYLIVLENKINHIYQDNVSIDPLDIRIHVTYVDKYSEIEQDWLLWLGD